MVTFTCSCTLPPFVDTRREAGSTVNVGESTKDGVAICDNQLTTTPTEILKLAHNECAKTGRIPKFHKQTSWSCRFLLPTHVYYNCVNP